MNPSGVFRCARNAAPLVDCILCSRCSLRETRRSPQLRSSLICLTSSVTLPSAPCKVRDHVERSLKKQARFCHTKKSSLVSRQEPTCMLQGTIQYLESCRQAALTTLRRSLPHSKHLPPLACDCFLASLACCASNMTLGHAVECSGPFCQTVPKCDKKTHTHTQTKKEKGVDQ